MSNTIVLPTELVENIISEAWVSDLSPLDRITLITSSFLVNKTWKALFTFISFKDVYIPSHSYLEYYLRAIGGYSLYFDKDNKYLPDQLCQSLTIQITEANDITDEPPMAKVLSDLLYYLTGVAILPNLRTLNIAYENVGFNDLLECDRLVRFPAQITDLNISFAFDSPPATIHQELSHSRISGLKHRGLRHLSLAGTNDALAKSISACFPNVKSPLLLPAPKLVASPTPQHSPAQTRGRSVYIDNRKCAAEIWASTACWLTLLNSTLLGSQ